MLSHLMIRHDITISTCGTVMLILSQLKINHVYSISINDQSLTHKSISQNSVISPECQSCQYEFIWRAVMSILSNLRDSHANTIAPEYQSCQYSLTRDTFALDNQSWQYYLTWKSVRSILPHPLNSNIKLSHLKVSLVNNNSSEDQS